MSRPAASSSAAAAAAGDGPAIKATTYRPPTVAGLSTALLPARDSLGSMLATAPAAARKQARADAEERKEEEFAAANGENGNKRMRMTLSEEAAQQRAAAAAAAGGAAGSGSPALSSRVPPPMILSRSFSVPGAAAGGPLADAAAAAGDHGLGFDLNANVEDDFFDSIDPGSARNSLWNAQGLANLRANAVTTPVPAATTAAASSASAAAAASSAAAAADDAAFAQLTFPDPPLDWNLHSRIRFTSPSSFDWVSGSSSPAATDHALEGVQTFMALGRADACDCRNVSPLRELHHALSYSTFPASPFGKLHPLTSVLRTALNKPREQRGQMDQLQLTHLQRLWIQWEDSFRSLYYRTRLPPASPAWLDHFYSIHRGGPGSGGGLLTYCVLFLAADPDEAEGEDAEGPGAPGSLEKAPAALISRSNRGLRAMLTAKGVGFTMPNDPRSRSEKAANQSGSLDGAAMTDGPDPLSRQLSTQQQKRINQSIADEDLTCASVLLVQGRKGQTKTASLLSQLLRSRDVCLSSAARCRVCRYLFSSRRLCSCLFQMCMLCSTHC